MTLKTASMSLSSTEAVSFNVVYYSRGSLAPALLAAVVHCLPDIDLSGSVTRARSLLAGGNRVSTGDTVRLLRCGNAAGGETVYAAAAGIPSTLVERTLADFIEIACGGPARCLVAAGLPRFCRCILDPCRHEHYAHWRETGKLVEQVKLRLRAEFYRSAP